MLSNKFNSILQLGIVAGALITATAASSQTSFYSSRATFNAALSTLASNDLNVLANGSTVISFGSLGLGTLSGASVTAGQIDNPNNGGAFTYTVTFSQLLNGFGADFTSPASFASARANINAFNGTTFLGSIAFGNFAGSNPSFLGITTVDSFNKIVVSENSSFGLQLFQSVDNLTVGAISPVPEPATISLFLTGLLIVGALVGRHSRTILLQTAYKPL